MSKLMLRDLIAVAFFAALITVGAWISFPLPFSPVPIVLANLFVVLSGAILGKWLGPLSVVVYLLMGLAGIPVFANHMAGPSVIAGPTGGYLIGYVLASFVTGLLVEYLPHFSGSKMAETVRFAFSLSAGGLVIYLTGIPWLARVAGMDLQTALVKGFYPYLPGDAVKIIVGTMLCISLMAQLPHIWKWPAGDIAVRQAAAEDAKAG
ncbi:MAG: biotin transporter BioY [Thermoleophilia bacterium]|nr:biotin transporter BioY [Thermoleophilia bacterium]